MTPLFPPNKEIVEECLFGVETETMCDELVKKERELQKVQVARFKEVRHPLDYDAEMQCDPHLHKSDFRPKDQDNTTLYCLLALACGVIAFTVIEAVSQ